MTDTATILTASTNLTSGKTTTTTMTLPPEVMELPKEQRNLEASAAIIENNESLVDSENEVRERIDPVLDGKEASISIETGQNITIINNINAPNAVVIVNPQDRSENVINITPDNVFSELRKIVSDQIMDAQERSKLLSKIQELEGAKSLKSYMDKYSEFVMLASKHITFFNTISPFLPVLFKVLTG